MADLHARLIEVLSDPDGGAWHEDWCAAKVHGDCCAKECDCLLGPAVVALRAVLAEHPRSVLSAGVLPERFGDGRCAYCGSGDLIREYRGHLNGAARKSLMHDHFDLKPDCATCASGYEGRQDWPCPTVRAVAAALLGEASRDG